MTKRKLSAISFVVGLLSLFPARGLAAGGSDSAPDSIASPKQGIMEVMMQIQITERMVQTILRKIWHVTADSLLRCRT